MSGQISEQSPAPLFLMSFPFWMVCVLAFGTTMLRETFNLWTPTYFVQFVHLGLQASRRAAARYFRSAAAFLFCLAVS